MNWTNIIFYVVLFYFIYRLIRYFQRRKSRYIPTDIKKSVLRRYFGMCAVCTETNLLEYHHRKPHSEGGDNSEQNVVPLCPKHHSMVKRLENDIK